METNILNTRLNNLPPRNFREQQNPATHQTEINIANTDVIGQLGEHIADGVIAYFNQAIAAAEATQNQRITRTTAIELNFLFDEAVRWNQGISAINDWSIIEIVRKIEHDRYLALEEQVALSRIRPEVYRHLPQSARVQLTEVSADFQGQQGYATYQVMPQSVHPIKKMIFSAAWLQAMIQHSRFHQFASFFQSGYRATYLAPAGVTLVAEGIYTDKFGQDHDLTDTRIFMSIEVYGILHPVTAVPYVAALTQHEALPECYSELRYITALAAFKCYEWRHVARELNLVFDNTEAWRFQCAAILATYTSYQNHMRPFFVERRKQPVKVGEHSF